MSTRPPIPAGRPPPYAFVGRIYRRNLRPVVITCGVLAGLWSLLWGISEFQAISVDKSSTIPVLAKFDIVLGALFLATTVIEIYGIAAALSQRLALVRLYATLSLLAAVIVFAADLMQIVLDFVYKNQLLDECTDANSNGLTGQLRGWWGSSVDFTNPGAAAQFCKNLFDHDTFADFAWLFVSTILGLMFSAVVFSYYRQLLDPSNSAWPRGRAASDRIRMETFQTQYGFPPPEGAPPAQNDNFVPPYDPHKLPSYDYTEQHETGPEKEPVVGYGVSTNPFERRAEEA